MKRIITLIALLFSASLSGGCGSGNVRVAITNDLGARDITEVYVDASDQPWGQNRITVAVEPGEQIVISVPAGTYDIMLIDSDGDSYTRWNIATGSGGYSWHVTLADID